MDFQNEYYIGDSLGPMIKPRNVLHSLYSKGRKFAILPPKFEIGCFFVVRDDNFCHQNS